MPVLDNPRHEKFAQLVAKGGISDLRAYMAALDANEESANTNAWRLREDEGISARIRELQERAADKVVLSMAERRAFLARVVRANLTSFDFERDGDLLQELQEERIGDDRGEILKRKIKLPGKRECVMDDARLAGELKETIAVEPKGSLEEALSTMVGAKRKAKAE